MKKILSFGIALAMVICLNSTNIIYAGEFNGGEKLDPQNKQDEALIINDDSISPRMSLDGTQVMSFEVDKLSPGNYLSTHRGFEPLSKSYTFSESEANKVCIECTNYTSGDNTKVGFVYLDTFTGYEQVATKNSISSFAGAYCTVNVPGYVGVKLYGYVENAGTTNLKASYVVIVTK